MATLTADLSVMIPGTGLTLLDQLDLDPSLLDAMPAEDREDPDGSVALARGAAFILLEDPLFALLAHFTETLPAALDAGTASVYKLRSAPSVFTVTLDGESARLDHDGLKAITLPVTELRAALDRIALDAQQLEAMLDPETIGDD